jgi:hypothetical protein
MVSSEEIRRRLEAKRRGETISEVNKTPPSSSPSSKTCPECQTPNPDSAKFCVGCGAPLAREETPTTSNEGTPATSNKESPATSSGETPIVTPTTPETTPADNYKQCPSCGQKNKPDAKFCIICGNKFEKEVAVEEEAAAGKPLEPLVDVVEEEKEVPVAETKPIVSPSDNEADLQEPVTEQEPVETSETEIPEKSVIPEVKVPEHFKSNNVQPEKEISPAESAEVQSKEETAPDEDPVLKIKKAKELLDIGAITQEEFDKIKNKYLDLI